MLVGKIKETIRITGSIGIGQRLIRSNGESSDLEALRVEGAPDQPHRKQYRFQTIHLKTALPARQNA